MNGFNASRVDQRFGHRVRQLREQMSISQDVLANTLRTQYGVQWHQTTVAKVESGERPAKLSEVVALSLLFAADLPFLLALMGHHEDRENPRAAQQQLGRRDELERIIRHAQQRLSELPVHVDETGDDHSWPIFTYQSDEGGMMIGRRTNRSEPEQADTSADPS